MKRLTAGIVLLTCLACGGALGAEEVHQAILAGCESDVGIPVDMELVRLDQDLPAPELAVLLQLGGEPWLLDGTPVEPEQLEGRLQAKAQSAKALADATGSDAFAFRGELLLLVTPDTTGATLLKVFELTRAAEFSQIRFIVRTGDKPAPPYLAPDYGVELEARVRGAAAEERGGVIAAELEELLVACPPSQEAFAAVATASAEMKCQMMAHGMAEALPKCPLTDDAKVVTVLQVMSRSAPYEHGVLSLTLDPEGTVHPVDPTAPWSTLAPWWAEQDTDAPAWWVAETDAG